MSFIWTPWHWLKTEFIHATQKQNTFLDASSSSRSLSCKRRPRARKRHRLPLYGCLVFSSNVRQLFVQFFNSGLVMAAFLQPLGTSSSKAAKTVKFVNCKTSTLCSFFVDYKTLWRRFCWEYLLTLPSRRGSHEFESIQCVKKSEASNFYVFQYEPKN